MKPSYFKTCLNFLLNLGGQNRPPNVLRHVLTTERDGGGHIVSCASSRLKELYELNGCFATVPIISTWKIAIFSSIIASLRLSEGKFRNCPRICLQAQFQLKCKLVSPPTEVFCYCVLSKCSWIRERIFIRVGWKNIYSRTV